MIDTIAVATGLAVGGFDVMSLLPFLSPFGIMILLLAWFFRAEIKVWLTSRSFDRTAMVEDVEAMKDELKDHTEKEDTYWRENTERMQNMNLRVNSLEITNIETKSLLSANHEETKVQLAEISHSMSKLTEAFIKHVDK
jgi:acyl-CoA synthetase (AMP-forming)/AMP-acid ligase II